MSPSAVAGSSYRLKLYVMAKNTDSYEFATPGNITATINGSLTAEFSYEPFYRRPGGYALLTFEPTEITSLSLTLSCESGVGEVKNELPAAEAGASAAEDAN